MSSDDIAAVGVRLAEQAYGLVRYQMDGAVLYHSVINIPRNTKMCHAA